MPENTIEISVKGKWVTARSLQSGDKTIVIKGRWLKIAVVHDEEWLETELQDPAASIRELRAMRPGSRADILTFTQKIPSLQPRHKYATEWDSIAVARIESVSNWWDSLPQETRKNVRRSQKRGVVVAVRPFDDDLVLGIREVNNDSPVRQGRAYSHYGKSIEQVRKDHAAFLDRCDFVGAYCGEEMIGFLKIVYRGDVASILQLTCKASHYDKRAANALLAKAVELCEERKLRYLIYGKFNYGNKGETSIREFKSRNGFEEMLAPRFYVPLTIWGRICMALNLHRGIIGILPKPVIASVVSGRAKFYAVKDFLSRCSSMLERPIRNRQMGRSIPPAGSINDPHASPNQAES